ncbi:MAG: GNAT family N-acetyltransferase [Rhodospirillaceae bacterium]|nr:GNAT family N-acetyltransferase [Rhodospirillaceae bacterium]|tara:strand:+ start:3200 stop:4378 length:1179 start_codon:yes stop_codon:yes gene_type:complete
MEKYNNLKKKYLINNITNITSINNDSWNSCAGTSNPFVSYEFLETLEESNCISEKTGWIPYHLTVNDKENNLVACCPLYVKTHSQGEYVFDHSWANALEQAGGNYYPKLLVAIPFTPVSGPRLLVKSKNHSKFIKNIMIERIIEIAKQNNFSSLHLNFTQNIDNNILLNKNFLSRVGIQFHWKNNDYKDFNDFLFFLSSRKRKSILKEREKALKEKIKIYTFTGKNITCEHLESFYKFYIDTTSKKWGIPYLNKKFFNLLNEKINNKIVLIMAKRQDEWVAGAMNLLGEDTLYGRYWGCLEEHKFLHFEICYYQAIDFAIKNKITNVQAGAQGPHKLSRGYLPEKTYSWHWLNNSSLNEAVKKFLIEEKKSIDQTIDYFKNLSPYKNNENIT